MLRRTVNGKIINSSLSSPSSSNNNTSGSTTTANIPTEKTGTVPSATTTPTTTTGVTTLEGDGCDRISFAIVGRTPIFHPKVQPKNKPVSEPLQSCPSSSCTASTTTTSTFQPEKMSTTTAGSNMPPPAPMTVSYGGDGDRHGSKQQHPQQYSGLSALILAATSQLGHLIDNDTASTSEEGSHLTPALDSDGDIRVESPSPPGESPLHNHQHHHQYNHMPPNFDERTAQIVIPNHPTYQQHNNAEPYLSQDGHPHSQHHRNQNRSQKSAHNKSTGTPAGTGTTTTSTTTSMGSTNDGRSLTFPEQLMTLLMDTATNQDIVTFLPDGKYFAIRRKVFVERYLHSTFNLQTYEEFLELMRGWGFVRVNTNHAAVEEEEEAAALNNNKNKKKESSSSSSSVAATTDTVTAVAGGGGGASGGSITGTTATATATSSNAASVPSSTSAQTSKTATTSSTIQASSKAAIQVFKHPQHQYFRKGQPVDMDKIRFLLGKGQSTSRQQNHDTASAAASQLLNATASPEMTRTSTTATTMTVPSRGGIQIVSSISDDSSTSNFDTNTLGNPKRRLSPSHMNRDSEDTLQKQRMIMDHLHRQPSSSGRSDGVGGVGTGDRHVPYLSQGTLDQPAPSARMARRRSSLELRGMASEITTSQLNVQSHEQGEDADDDISSAVTTTIMNNGSRSATTTPAGSLSAGSQRHSQPHAGRHSMSSSAGLGSSEGRKRERRPSLVDGAVEAATHTIVTDAIETLLFDEGHTRETYQKHEKELSISSLPGVVPISKQLFSGRPRTESGSSDLAVRENGMSSYQTVQEAQMSAVDRSVPGMPASLSAACLVGTDQSTEPSVIPSSSSSATSSIQRQVTSEQHGVRSSPRQMEAAAMLVNQSRVSANDDDDDEVKHHHSTKRNP